jgi:hypothetical protein
VTAGVRSFVADRHGTLDKITGEIVMAGAIVSGWRAGAAVMERKRLSDAIGFSFEGDIAVLDGHRSVLVDVELVKTRCRPRPWKLLFPHLRDIEQQVFTPTGGGNLKPIRDTVRVPARWERDGRMSRQVVHGRRIHQRWV